MTARAALSVLAPWAVLLAVATSSTALERFGVSMEPPPAVQDADQLEPAVRADYRARLDRLNGLLADPKAARPDLVEAWGGFGQWCHAYRYYDRARRAYQVAEALAPDDFRWPYYLAHVHERQGDFNAAVAAYRRAIARRPDYLAALVRLAEIEFKANRAREAESLAARILDLQPDQPRGLLLQAQLYLARDEYQAALALLERAEQVDPDGPQVHYLLARAHRGLGEREAAARELAAWEADRSRDEAALDDPLMAQLEWIGDSAQVRQARGRELLAEGRSADAIETLRKAVKEDPQNMTARINLGVTLFQSGDIHGAIEAFEEVLRLHPSPPPHPDLATAHFDLCAVLETQGLLIEAEAQCRASLRSDPDQYKANIVLARLLLRTGRPEESLVPFEKAIVRDPAAALPRYERARALLAAGHVEQAVASLESDLETLPGDPLLQISLARLLAAAPGDGVRDGARALALARAAHKRAPSVASAETLAMAAAESGDFLSAVSWQRSAQRSIDAVRTAVDPRWVGERLARYERGQPCREPWVEREAVTFEIPLQP